MIDKKIIRYGKDGSTFIEGKGWFSRQWHFFGNYKDSEHRARFYSCTHTKCKSCNNMKIKTHLYCSKCKIKNKKTWAIFSSKNFIQRINQILK